jgi:hypothetical protein
MVIIIYFDINKIDVLQNIDSLKYKELREGIIGGEKLYYGLIYTNNNELLTFLPLPNNFNKIKTRFEYYLNNIEYVDKIQIY